jgi:BNR repeat protein
MHASSTQTPRAGALTVCASCGVLAALAACGGGGGSAAAPTSPPPAAPPAFTSVKQVRVSQPPTFSSGCDGVAATGTLYADTAAEPYLAANSTNPLNLVAAWQQNRWSDGGSQGVNLAASFDGGTTWKLSAAAFSRCTGGNPANGADYARATDVWISFAPNGVAFALSLSFTGASLSPGSSNAQLVARSSDGGQSWSAPTALIQDGSSAFNDKGSITADANDASYVYAVWDRLIGQSAGPSYLALTSDGGASWQAARSIYDPGPLNQTLGNQIVVLPSGAVVALFTELDTGAGGAVSALVRAMQSTDHGASWSGPVTVAELTPVGTTDPNTGTPVRDGSQLVSASAAPGGVIYLAWQDSRFSGGLHDGIAMTHSSDGGLTWSAPLQVNADHDVQAFTPTIHVRADGVIGVSYYDLRNDTTSAAHLWTDRWLVSSSDGVTFTETHLSGPFDLDLAADSEGLFLGDYEALASVGSDFLPLYVQTNPGTQASSDAFVAFPPAAAAAQLAARMYRAAPAGAGVHLSAAARQRIGARLARERDEHRNQPRRAR